jgi:hypothetical protein
MPQIKVITPIDLNPNDFDLGILVANKISTKKTQADWNETLATAPGFILNKPALTGTAPIDLLTSTSTTAPLSANQGKVLKDLVDLKRSKGTTPAAGKLMIESATGLDNTSSTLSLVDLEKQVISGYANPLSLDARLAVLETAQPTFDDVLVVAALPATGVVDKLYVVTSGTGKNKSFYWDGTVFTQTDNEVQSFTAKTAFPATGEDGKLYVAKTGTDKGTYYWDGTTYQATTSVVAVTNALSSAVNTMTSTVNGTAVTAPIVNSVSNTSTINDISTTVNGVTGGSVSIINSNVIALTAGVLTTTINGITSNAVTITDATTADNGLTKTGNNIALGGSLLAPTVITTTAANTLAIAGLPTGVATDTGLVVDAAGVIKKAPASTVVAPYQELGKVIAPFTNYTVPHAQGDINPNIGIYVTSTNGFGKVNVFGNNIDSDNIFVFDPTTADVKIRNNSADPITVDIYIKK